MANKRGLIRLLAFYFLFVTFAQADVTWFVFWSMKPTDRNSVSQVEALLEADAATVNDKPAFKPVRANYLDNGETSATWFWWVKIEESKTKEKKYQDLLQTDLADMINIKDLLPPPDPEDPRPDFPPDDDILKPQPAADIPKLSIRSNDRAHQQRRNGQTKRAPRPKRPPQTNAPRQLVFICLPEDKDNDVDHNTDYNYDPNAGKGARVYVIDSGLNLASSEWESDAGRPEPNYLYVGFGNQQLPYDLDTVDGHGTCMADLVGGDINGVAKEVLLTMVQQETENFKASTVTAMEAAIEAVSAVVDNAHLIRKKPATEDEKHVVLMAWEVSQRTSPDKDYQNSNAAFVTAFYTTLKELDDRGTGLVTAMGNHEKCNAVPCKFGTPDKTYPYRIANLVTVGSGLINDGDFAYPPEERDEPDFYTVYGPGDDRRDGGEGKPGILCAAPTGDENQKKPQAGTSHASALTAGLMAYHMGNGLDRDSARQLIVGDAYARYKSPAGDGPEMIWNGHS